MSTAVDILADGLRDDQLDVVERTREEFRKGVREVLLQSPTGFGKTHTVLHMAQRSVEMWKRVLFIAPLKEIALDTYNRLARAGRRVGLLMDGVARDIDAPVLVALPRTLLDLIESGTIPVAHFIIVDEARHVMAATYLAIVKHYPTAHVLGLDATPERGDGRGLGDAFKSMVLGPSIADMVRAGTLAPMTVIAAAAPKPKTLPCTAHQAWERWGRKLPAIVFASNRAHARAEAEPWGLRAIVLDANTKPAIRDTARERIAGGELDALCVVGIGREGFDCKALAVAVNASKCNVLSDYLQRAGRVRRPKPWSCFIDLTGSVYLHGLPDEDRVWSLDGIAARLKRPGASITVRRCNSCLAVFFPASKCPACGAPMKASTLVPRSLNAVDKLALVEHIPMEDRDRAYMRELRRVARVNMRADERDVDKIALRLFEKQFKRKPAEVAA